MIKMKPWAVLLVLLAVGCAAPKKDPPPKPFVGTRWYVVLDLPVAGEQPNVRFGDGRMEGFGGCNRFMARYTQDSVGARSIAIGRIDVIRRLCDPSIQASEARVLEVLQSVSSYSITADAMSMSGSGGTLRFVALPEEVPLVGTRWIAVVDSKIEPGSTPWIEFVTQERLSGFSGCNLLNGTWRNEGGQVRIGSLAMTKRGCIGPAGDLEQRVLKSLNDQGRVTREGSKLLVTGPGGERLEFKQAGEAPR
jgi:heat shock protein HslJ